MFHLISRISSFIYFCFVLECHGSLSCSVTAVCAADRGKKIAVVMQNNNCCVSPPSAPQITLLSTSMISGLPLASLCFLLCPEWHCSLRAASLIDELRYVPPERMSAWGRREGL